MKSFDQKNIRKCNVRKGTGKRKERVSKECLERLMGQVRSLADATGKHPESRTDIDPIRVASDCTGLGSEIIALALLGLLPRVKSVHWSENDKQKQKLYRCVCEKLKHKVGPLDVDMTQRSFDLDGCTSNSRNVDLYVAGYPCPSFSTLGRKRGGLDPRGLIPLYGLQWIIKEQPKACVLENVAGLLHKKHRLYVAFLREILAKMGYVVFKKKMSTLEYGIPQSRCRVYIVAIRADAKKEKFKWPHEIKFSKSWLKTFLETSKKGQEKMTLANYENKYGATSIWNDAYVLDIGSSDGFQSAKPHRVPCLTRSRMKGKESGYYIPRLLRRLNSVEGARLQGIPSHLAAPTVKATSEGSLWGQYVFEHPWKSDFSHIGGHWQSGAQQFFGSMGRK